MLSMMGCLECDLPMGQVREEAVAATKAGDEPSRAAADDMVYTVSSLKVH